jgi:predicted ATPase
MFSISRQRRQQTLDAVKRLLLRESEVRPLVVIFEDLHWIDGETQSLLDSLVESLPAARLLLLVNYRPEYSHAWGSKTYYRQLRIDPLPAENADELLDALFGIDAALAPLKILLVERTDANPLSLEEGVRTLLETRALVGGRGAYRLIRPVEQLKMPATVQTILAARIDRLAPEAKRLLQAAAVIGKDVPIPLLLAIADAPQPEVRAELTRLQSAEFLYESGSSQTLSIHSSTRSRTRWPIRGCSTTVSAPYMPASPKPSSGSRASASPSERSGWPITPFVASCGRRRSHISGRRGSGL